ncbi:uncharacterized protein LOC135954977 [Calliphora vicina]|uniref:uncharacterized protein LOC135954977 n=1 Tax=Calliphora vicina TaxID=7373 RepID=UPI00325BBAAD
MKTSLLFYIILIFFIILVKSQVISGHSIIHLQHGDHSINLYAPQKEFSTFTCRKGPYVSYHTYPNDCTKFIECYNGGKFKKNCAPGTAFDKDRAICDHKHKVKCDYWNTTNYHIPQPKEIFDIACPHGTVGKYPYSFHNTYYLECIQPKTIIKICPFGMQFNKTQGLCIRTVDVAQTEQPNNDDLYKYLHKCPSTNQGQFYYPFNARKYIKCSWGELKVLDCGPSELFSISQGICLPEKLVPPNDHVVIPTPTDSNGPAKPDDTIYPNPTTTESNVPAKPDSTIYPKPTPTESNGPANSNDIIYCPMDLFGLFPHPFSNEKYLQCADGRLYAESCRTGFVYDIFSKFCEPNLTNSFTTLPRIQNNYTAESTIETRSNDSLTLLKCPADLVGTFIHPIYCTKYIKCSPAGTNIETCSTGEIFSFRKGKCGLQSEMDENDHIVCLPKNDNKDTEESFSVSLGVYCKKTGTMKYPHPESWYKYVHCDNGKLHIKFCPRNEVFNLEIRECMTRKRQ